MKKFLVLLGILMFFAINAFADIRLPDTPKPTPEKKSKEVSGSMLIKIDDKTNEAVLLLNKSQINQLRASLDEADDEGETRAGIDSSRVQTIVSGLFLSLGFIFGGVWLSSRSKPSKIVVGLFLFAVVGAASTLVFANAGPPSSLRSISSRMFSDDMKGWRWGYGKIKIKIVDENKMTDHNNAAELVVPRAEEDKKSE